MRPVPLGGLHRGIDRTRIRGAQVDGALYDLKNAYITIAGHVKKRPPFKKAGALDASTKGLFGNAGKLHSFYAGSVMASPVPSLIALHALQPPVVPDGQTQPTTLEAVYFDALFLGKQYVIAKFNDDVYRHYWLSDPQAWKASANYNVNTVVQPDTPNGFYYKVANNQFPQAWQPKNAYKLGDVVVPSTLNGWKYTVVDAVGTNPSSGSTEPTWPVSDGATITEEHDDTPANPTPPQTPPSNPGGGRYGNPGGSGRFGVGRGGQIP